LDAYPTVAAATAAKGLHSTVVESLGKIWLLTVADQFWRPSVGERIATVGPLQIKPETNYTAVYMEAVFAPGTSAAIHSHSGPEAFYTLTGETCLETPDGMLAEQADGRGLVVPEGPAMLLTATGHARRRSIALILHDSSQPATTMVHDWTPKRLCR
jgi:quercetin dioxygenase-like cupin family protein